MKRAHLQYTLLGLILLEILITGFVMTQGSSAFCVGESDCASVQSSSYGTLLGIKLPVFGFSMFTLLLIFFLFAQKSATAKKLFFLATLLGALFACYFLSLQFFVLGKVCSSCLLIDSTAILMGIIACFWRKSHPTKYF